MRVAWFRLPHPHKRRMPLDAGGIWESLATHRLTKCLVSNPLYQYIISGWRTNTFSQAPLSSFPKRTTATNRWDSNMPTHAHRLRLYPRRTVPGLSGLPRNQAPVSRLVPDCRRRSVQRTVASFWNLSPKNRQTTRLTGHKCDEISLSSRWASTA